MSESKGQNQHGVEPGDRLLAAADWFVHASYWELFLDEDGFIRPFWRWAHVPFVLAYAGGAGVFVHLGLTGFPFPIALLLVIALVFAYLAWAAGFAVIRGYYDPLFRSLWNATGRIETFKMPPISHRAPEPGNDN